MVHYTVCELAVCILGDFILQFLLQYQWVDVHCIHCLLLNVHYKMCVCVYVLTDLILCIIFPLSVWASIEWASIEIQPCIY